MTTIQLGFKAFDPHELLCHFIATRAGLYKRENINVELIDITFIAETDLPVHIFQASCGAALSSALRGIPQKIIFVATDKPMFWIYSSNTIPGLDKLSNAKMATFPVTAPPHQLANIILESSGIDIEKELMLLPARDDVARFGLLKSGCVDAALISSAIAPAKIRRAGFNKLCFFGDVIRIPTTGLAVDQAFLDQEPQLAQTLVSIHKESLSIMHNDLAMLATVLQESFDVDEDFKIETAELYEQYYTRAGRTTAEIAQKAIASLCTSLSVSTVPVYSQIYKFDS